MLRLEYIPDVYIETVYQRMMASLPEGTFYPRDGISLPYTLDPTRFKLQTDYPGLRHVVRSTTIPVLEFPVIPHADYVDLAIPLQPGAQTLTIHAYDDMGKILDSYALPLTVLNFGTLMYAGAQTIVKEWVTAIDLYSQVLSGYQLLVFETSLPDSLRELLPSDYNTKLLALKNLMRVSVLGSSNEGINSYISAVCQMNPPKISKYFNRTALDEARIEDASFEVTTSDIKLWFGSYAMGRRAVLARMVNNFPNRYRDIIAGNSSMVRGLTEHVDDLQSPAFMTSSYSSFSEKDDADLTISLAIPSGQGLEVSMESEQTLFVPNYHFTDYHAFHGIHASYEPANERLYGNQAWLSDPLGNLDRIADIYAIPDMAESRIDSHGLSNIRDITFHASNTALRSNYGLEEATREDYEAIDEAHVGMRRDDGDRLRLDIAVGSSQPWISNDWDFDVIDNRFALDYHQGLKVTALSWGDMTIDIEPTPQPYLTAEENTSVLILPGRSRSSAPGTRPQLDDYFFYSEDESFDDGLLGVDMHGSSELWMRLQRQMQLPMELYNGQPGPIPVHLRYCTLNTGIVEIEDNPFRLLRSGVEVGSSSFWSNAADHEGFLQTFAVANAKNKLLLAMQRDSRTGAHTLLLQANANADGSATESSSLRIVLRGLPLGIEVFELEGAIVSVYRDRYEIELAWYGSTRSGVVFTGFQGFDSLMETKQIRLSIDSDATYSDVRCEELLIVGPNRNVRTGLIGGAELALELLY